jgi:hypothetical protein
MLSGETCTWKRIPVARDSDDGRHEIRFATLVSPLALYTVFITAAAVTWINLLGGVTNHSELPAYTLKSTTRT